MKLCELSEGYVEAAHRLRRRMKFLRKQYAQEKNLEQRLAIKSELNILAAILTQCNELAELTAHYYERGYARNGKYTI